MTSRFRRSSPRSRRCGITASDEPALELREFVRSCGFDPDAPTAVVCHDAGGAEIVARITRDALTHPIVHVEGPARAVFSAVLKGAVTVEEDLRRTIMRSSQAITGTGWQTDVERRAAREARSVGVRVAAVLDHWVHYTERFVDNGLLTLPDQVWVGDDTARDLAAAEFPRSSVRLFRNPCFREFADAVIAARARSPLGRAATAVFISDNVTEFARAHVGSERGFGFTQFDALELVVRRCREIDLSLERIVVRPHPSEDVAAFERFVRGGARLPIALSEGSLVDDVAMAGVVFGLRSMALYMAAEAGVRAITVIPATAHGYSCPPWGLESLQD